MSDERDAGTAGPDGGDVLAAKLDRLFRIHPATLREVADAVTRSGTPLSYSYLSQLRKGHRGRPSGEVLAGIATFFGVDVTYFLGGPEATDRVDAELDLREVMANQRVRDLAVRASHLSPDGQRALAAFIAHLEHEDSDLSSPSSDAPEPRRRAPRKGKPKD